MAQVRVVTDSTADIPPEVAEELGIVRIPLNVHFGETTYKDGVDLTTDRFFELLKASRVHPHTSQPSVGEFEELYRQLARETDQIFSIHLSSLLSGTYNSARMAAANLPPSMVRVEVMDSMTVSIALGLMAIEAAKAARQGATLEEVAGVVKRMINQTHLLFFVETLEYLHRGGRIGRAAAFLGTLMRVKPILTITDGVVTPYERARTRNKAIEALYALVEDFPHVERVGIIHSGTPDDVERLIEMLLPLVPRDRILVARYGPVLGVHAGPGAMGVAVFEGFAGEG